MLFPPSVHATAVGNDGTEKPLPRGTMRVAEFTRGPLGPSAMPGEMAPTVAYTYASSLAFDEAADAKTVRFDAKVVSYLDNFLHQKIGAPVPSGTYDHATDAWSAEESGRVVAIVDQGGGKVGLDSDGDGKAGDAAGAQPGELDAIAAFAKPGASFWRVALAHFSVEDSVLGDGTENRSTAYEDGTKTTWTRAADGTTTAIAPDGTITVARSGSGSAMGHGRAVRGERSTTTKATFGPAGGGSPMSLVNLETSTVDPDGTWLRSWDAAARVTTWTSAAGRVMRSEVDERGRVTKVTMPGALAVQVLYDARGHVASVAQGERRVEIDYDPSTGYASASSSTPSGASGASCGPATAP